MNILEIKKAKQDQKKISMLTCYDYWSATLLEKSSVDLLLVGDSVGMVLHGHSDTLPVDTETMALHVKAVRRGAPSKFVIADLPFLSFRKSLDTNMNNVETLMKAGANAVKLEGAPGNLQLIEHIVESGVPVMGHLGLTPQSVHQLGGFRVQGRESKVANEIKTQSRQLEDAGCFSLVLECVPAPIAQEITSQLSIPTIGIGAGVDVDGQVLVLQDMLGLSEQFKPRFVRKFLNGHELLKEAFNDFDTAVKDKSFPSLEESYE